MALEEAHGSGAIPTVPAVLRDDANPLPRMFVDDLLINKAVDSVVETVKRLQLKNSEKVIAGRYVVGDENITLSGERL